MADRLDRDDVRRASPLEVIIPALTGQQLHRANGRGEPAIPCPWHDDKRPSLRINIDKQVWRCDPCDIGGDVFDFVARHQGADFPGALRFLADRAGMNATTKREVASYDYTDEQGKVLYQAVRFEPKDFRQRRPDGAGGWIWNMTGVRRVPYKLHAIQGKEAAAIAEGEKDVDALWALGIPATCNVGGAKKWRDSDSELLHAAGVRRVLVSPDNDETGRQHRDQVAASCAKVGISVKVLTLPDVPDKGDVSDYLARHSKAELFALLKAAVPYTPPATAIADSGDATAPRLGPVVVRVSDVKSERVTWLWRQRIASGKLTLLMGDPGVGKSFITVDMASRITRGTAWPDVGSPGNPGNVLFLAIEDGIADTIRPRLERAGADLDRVFVFTTIREEGGERLPNFEQDMAVIEAQIAKLKPALIVIDPVSSYLGKTDSYKDADVRRVLAPLPVLADRHKVAVVALVHMTKGSKDGKALYRSMASIAFSALSRIHLAAGNDPEHPGRCFLMPVKQNTCAPAPALAYRLQSDPDDPDGAARLEWEDAPVDGVVADAILGMGSVGSDEREERQDAAEFLQQLLSDGRMRADEVLKIGKANGHSERTLNRAKKRAGAKSYKEGFRPGVWYWELASKNASGPTILPDLATFGGKTAVSPTQSTPLSKIATSPVLATFDGPEDDSEVGLV